MLRQSLRRRTTAALVGDVGGGRRSAQRARATFGNVARVVKIWTWDRGRRPVNMDGEPELLGPILETVLNGGLWEELERFPADTVERILPRIALPRNIRRLAEIWIEEKRRTAA